jgi:hypothetical protein
VEDVAEIIEMGSLLLVDEEAIFVSSGRSRLINS